tara:strand:+ start:117 stop:317 length:201 start_codon:yes stop_codon:yes gene_type:complete
MNRKLHMSITKFYECAEEIAKVLDKYLHTSIEDMDSINNLVTAEQEVALDIQNQQNLGDEINGGSK